MAGRAFEILSVVGILIAIVASVLAINGEVREVSGELEEALRAAIGVLEKRIDAEMETLARDIERNRGDIALVRERTWALARGGDAAVTLKTTNQELFRVLLERRD